MMKFLKILDAESLPSIAH